MAIINELVQWAAIAFVAFLTLGLTRQLGLYMVPRSEQLAAMGPDVGTQLSPEQLGDPDRRLAALASETDDGRVALLVVDETCETCVEIVAAVETNDLRAMPAVGLVKGSSDAFRARVAAAFDGVLYDHDGKRIDTAGIVATPFLIVLDGAYTVRHREVLGNATAAVRSLGLRDSSAADDHEQRTLTVAVHTPTREAVS